MDTKSPKERLMVALRKGKGDRVVALINQFPGTFYARIFSKVLPKR